ncbi:MAG: hypothetical protein M3Y56_11850 [Armatimonadota bacterium]|nr:hypothetical protein [Armatimonadota bacterium]
MVDRMWASDPFFPSAEQQDRTGAFLLWQQDAAQSAAIEAVGAAVIEELQGVPSKHSQVDHPDAGKLPSSMMQSIRKLAALRRSVNDFTQWLMFVPVFGPQLHRTQANDNGCDVAFPLLYKVYLRARKNVRRRHVNINVCCQCGSV